VRTIDYLTGPSADLFRPGVIAGVAIAVQCGALSVLVVLRRMAFVGQGVSHAALAGVGLGAALGLSRAGSIGIVAAVCLLAGIGIALLSGRLKEREDTAIGVFLVASMALGALLLSYRAAHPIAGAPPPPTWESLLFGSILAVDPTDAWLAWLAAGAALGALMWFRRPLLFWAFDEPSARAFGSPASGMRFLLLLLCALSIVVTMRLAGVVLATALLVLPGAIALRLTHRLAPAFGLSIVSSLAGMGVGLILSFESDLPPGACVVLALCALYACALAWSGIGRAMTGDSRGGKTTR
jgi:zinc transport system permease protein